MTEKEAEAVPVRYTGDKPSTTKVNDRAVQPNEVIEGPGKLTRKLLRYPDFEVDTGEPSPTEATGDTSRGMPLLMPPPEDDGEGEE